jgi:hypothetical protein
MAALGSLEIALHIFNSSLGLPCWNDSFVNIREIVKIQKDLQVKKRIFFKWSYPIPNFEKGY